MLPHAFRSPKTTSVCLFVKDLDRDRFHPDVGKDARAFQDFLAIDKRVRPGLIRQASPSPSACSLPFIEEVAFEVISLRQIKREYKTFEALRKLATAHDLFLCDERVLREVHRNLGKAFHVKAKCPYLLPPFFSLFSPLRRPLGPGSRSRWTW